MALLLLMQAVQRSILHIRMNINGWVNSDLFCFLPHKDSGLPTSGLILQSLDGH